MARNGMAEVAKSLRALLKEKQAVEAKEKALLTDLSAVLRSMGYQLAPVNSSRPAARPKARSAARASTPAPKKGTRKPMSPAARKAVARRMKAYWAKRRAGAKPTKK